MDVLSLVPYVVVPLAAGVAGFTDAWKFKVYNVLTIPFLVSGIVFHAAVSGVDGLAAALLGAAAGFVVLLIPYVLGVMGAGDVKLMMGVGAWLGSVIAVWVFFVAAILTALYSSVVLIQRRELGKSFAVIQVFSLQLMTLGRFLRMSEGIGGQVREGRSGRLVPFAVMICVAVAIVVVYSMNG